MTHLVFLAIILLFVAFLIGLFAGAWFRNSRDDVKSAPSGASAGAAQSVAASAPAARAVSSTPETASAGRTTVDAEPKAAEPSSQPPPAAQPEQEPAAPKEAPPLAPALEPAATPEPEASAAGGGEQGRPAKFDGPRGGKPDKLTRVKGIGPVNEKRLHDLGVYHFDQIAAWGAAEIAWVDDYLSFKGRIEREDWVGQAATLARE